jgi:hypothetical protein
MFSTPVNSHRTGRRRVELTTYAHEQTIVQVYLYYYLLGKQKLALQSFLLFIAVRVGTVKI